MSFCRLEMLTVAAAVVASSAAAQVTFTNTTSADAFLATGSPDNPAGTNLADLNFGGAGILAVSPASADKGEFQSVMRFDVSGAAAVFDAAYGTNGWAVGSIVLQLTSNYGQSGLQPNNKIFNVISSGQFVIEWLSNTNWIEGTGNPNLPTMDGVTFDSLPDLVAGAHEILCTNIYAPPGINVPVQYPLPLNTNLLAAVKGGGSLSLLFYAADNQVGYVFNSREYGRGNEPLIEVTANPVFKIVAGIFANGGFQIRGIGPTNLTYRVQFSPNPLGTNWLTIGSASPDTSGTIQFTDTNATRQGGRFYRLSL